MKRKLKVVFQGEVTYNEFESLYHYHQLRMKFNLGALWELPW